MGDDHIINSLRQIDPDSWLVGNLVLRRLPYMSASATWNDERDQSSYTLDEAPVPHPRTTPLVNNQYIEVVHEAGDASVVWAIGNSVFCKAKCIEEGATPEPSTKLQHSRSTILHRPRKQIIPLPAETTWTNPRRSLAKPE
jgi:hypothetical protein